MKKSIFLPIPPSRTSKKIHILTSVLFTKEVFLPGFKLLEKDILGDGGG
jgi:hypothetical protein